MEYHNRIHNKLPIALEGIPFFIISGAITILFFFLNFMILTVFMIIVSLFILYFFRDPERVNQVEANAILAPADGKILGVQSLKHDADPFNAPAIKVSVFMSVFNVHVNRVPQKGRISQIVYHPGRFFSANLDKASDQNEKNIISLVTEDGRKIVFVQIAGLIARRIACWVKEQDKVNTGQRFGLIRFGSRVDIYLPQDSRVIVQQGDRVKAGETILGHLSET